MYIGHKQRKIHVTKTCNSDKTDETNLAHLIMVCACIKIVTHKHIHVGRTRLEKIGYMYKNCYKEYDQGCDSDCIRPKVGGNSTSPLQVCTDELGLCKLMQHSAVPLCNAQFGDVQALHGVLCPTICPSGRCHPRVPPQRCRCWRGSFNLGATLLSKCLK